jgi:hypothetical protein
MKYTPKPSKRVIPIRRPYTRKPDVVPNPDGGKDLFWVVYIMGMLMYVIHTI